MKTPNKNKFVIKKVPLTAFLSLLNNLYADGADFVDLYGEIDGTGLYDTVTVAVPLEYMSKEFREENSAPPPPGIDDDDKDYEEYDDDEDVLTEKEITNLLKNI